jgi:2-polyprenyl-3-methyl-5-hydroxy-6-metoxy-1,4-benzoquinol methylase
MGDQDRDIADISHGHPERFVPHLMGGRLIDAEHRARYWWASSLVKGKNVLDAACGTGYGANILAAGGAASVVGVDRATHVIEFARRHAEGVASFEVGDLLELPFADAAFDVTVCFEAIEHVDRPDSALDELARVLHPDGLLAISSPNRDVYARGNPHHRYEFVPEELRFALRARFKHVRLLRQHDWLATAILDDEWFARSDGDAIANGAARKISPVVPGPETYTLALASDRALPAHAPLVVLARDLAVRRLIDEAERARVAAKKARDELTAIQSSRVVQYALTVRATYAALRRRVAVARRAADAKRIGG